MPQWRLFHVHWMTPAQNPVHQKSKATRHSVIFRIKCIVFRLRKITHLEAIALLSESLHWQRLDLTVQHSVVSLAQSGRRLQDQWLRFFVCFFSPFPPFVPCNRSNACFNAITKSTLNVTAICLRLEQHSGFPERRMKSSNEHASCCDRLIVLLCYGSWWAMTQKDCAFSTWRRRPHAYSLLSLDALFVVLPCKVQKSLGCVWGFWAFLQSTIYVTQ